VLPAAPDEQIPFRGFDEFAQYGRPAQQLKESEQYAPSAPQDAAQVRLPYGPRQ